MKKDIDKIKRELDDKDRGYRDIIELGLTCILRRSHDTNDIAILSVLDSTREVLIFLRLGGMIDSFVFNSITYEKLEDIGKAVHEPNLNRLRKVLNKFGELNLIYETKEFGYKRIYVNPYYYTKGLKLSRFTLKMFNPTYTPKKTKDNKVNRNPEDPSKIVNYGF